MYKEKLIKYVPLLILALAGLPGHTYYVEMTRGLDVGYNDLRRASADGLVAELIRLRNSHLAPLLITDTSSISFAKIVGVYTKGHQLLTPSKDFMAHMLREDERRATTATRTFDLKEINPGRAFNQFQEDLRATRAEQQPQDLQLLGTPPSQTILNKRSAAPAAPPIIVRSWPDVKNHLFLVESQRGQTYFGKNRLLTALFPAEKDAWYPNGSFSSTGRDLLLRIIHPSDKVRFVVGITTMNSTGELRMLPPVSVIGDRRTPFNLMGNGSARLVSAPVAPQWIHGLPYFALDMGRDGRPIEERRTGVMRLFNTQVPLDWRRCVALAREISAISEEEYQAMRPPEYISKIPEHLAQRDLEYSGIYEDGWISRKAFVTLSDPGGLNPLVIQGAIPQIISATFRDEIRVRLDGKEIARKSLGVGEFELRLTPPPGNRRRSVELEFGNAQQLANEDRQVSAILRCIGFTSVACAGSAGVEQADVVFPAAPVIRGNGWYPLEAERTSKFHWARSGAEIFAGSAVTGKTIVLDIEPGPSQAGHPLRLEIRDQTGSVLSAVTLAGRHLVPVKIPDHLSPDQRVHTLSLYALDPPKSAGSDPRTLDYRIFSAAVRGETAAPGFQADILFHDGVGIANNFYAIEEYKGERFRWVNNDAGIQITDPKAFPNGLAIEVEPGPGIAKVPMVLRVVDANGHPVHVYEVSKRQKLILFLPPGVRKGSVFRFHVENGGNRIPSDSRLLNFRVFRISSASRPSG
ncbi:MAG TPA: hypothetical protein VMZ52_04155 [Bryobacteraceae bacterium]|nr:hypothetical protein [Bryobacteraceae bacterium]